jgi:hypothetical protein
VFDRSATTWGAWSLVVAVVTAAIAWLTAAGGLTMMSWAFATVGVAGLVTFDPSDRPWTLVIAAAVMAVVSAAVAHWHPATETTSLVDVVGRWDLAPLFVATCTGVAAVLMAPRVDEIVPTWLGAGLLAMAIGLWRREWPWLIVGKVLVNLAAAWADPGWLALSLASSSVLSTWSAHRIGGPSRPLMQVTGAATAGGAWASFMVYLGWDPSLVSWTTALLAGALVAGLALALRWLRLGHDWYWIWSALGVVGLAAALVVKPLDERWPAGGGLAGGLLLLGVGTALAAGPIGLGWWRELSVAILGTAGLTFAWAADAGHVAVVAIALPLSAVALAAAIAFYKQVGSSPWWRPVGLGVLGALTVATVAALNDLPHRGLLVAVLAVAGGEAGAAGLLGPSAVLQGVAPILLCGAWIAYASEALTGEPLWFTMPIGLTLLVVVGVIRTDWHRGLRTGTPRVAELLEYSGMGFLVLPPFVEGISNQLYLVLLSALVGAGLALWGVMSEVRRRLWVGVVSVVIAVLVLLGVPMSKLNFNGEVKSSPLFWLAIVASGLIVVLTAVFIEQGKAKVRAVVHRVRELTKDWE